MAYFDKGQVDQAIIIVFVRRLKDGTMHWKLEGAYPVLQHRTAFIDRNLSDRSPKMSPLAMASFSNLNTRPEGKS